MSDSDSLAFAFLVGMALMGLISTLIFLAAEERYDHRWHQCVTACADLPVDDANDSGCVCRGGVWRVRQ